MAEQSLEVVQAGPQTTVQDLGRPGHAHLGVPRSGALDLPALRLGNRLVGNPEHAAALECLLGGLTFRVGPATTIAVTGALAPVRVGRRQVAWGSAVAVPAGALVEVGAVTAGLRAYIAIAGGIGGEEVLGSRSTDLLSGLGPAVIADGNRLWVGEVRGPPGRGEAVPELRSAPVLRMVLGPREDWLAPGALESLVASSYVVSGRSNRIGLRLDGPPLRRARHDELASEGIVLGSVQVPPNGQPVVFLNDHPVTGGYPVVGVVLPEDLAACAQARPGDRVRFQVVVDP